MSRIDGYVVITSKGELKRKRRGRAPASVFTNLGSAINFARNDGDSVVSVVVDLDAVEPVFIRKKTL